MLLDLITLNGPGHLYGASEQQQFLCQRGLTGIRVGNDGEGLAPVYFFLKLHNGRKDKGIRGQVTGPARTGYAEKRKLRTF